jgi:hypothetical protein
MIDGTTKRYSDGEALSGLQRQSLRILEKKVWIVVKIYLSGISDGGELIRFCGTINGLEGSHCPTCPVDSSKAWRMSRTPNSDS